jgi:hypothetical protein
MSIKVNSDLLAQAVETAGPKISGYTSTLDALSADIRTVEKWLLDSGVRFEVSEAVEEHSNWSGNSRSYLVWSGGKDGKTWRIYYRDDWEKYRVRDDVEATHRDPGTDSTQVGRAAVTADQSDCHADTGEIASTPPTVAVFVRIRAEGVRTLSVIFECDGEDNASFTTD